MKKQKAGMTSAYITTKRKLEMAKETMAPQAVPDASPLPIPFSPDNLANLSQVVPDPGQPQTPDNLANLSQVVPHPADPLLSTPDPGVAAAPQTFATPKNPKGAGRKRKGQYFFLH